MKRLLVILLIAAAGMVAACSPGSTPSPAIDAPAATAAAPSDGASQEDSMAPDESASTTP